VDERTVKLTLEYDGAAYHGWQRQAGVRTVQGDLEAAIETVLRVPVTVHGQGRTDSGVHAEGQVAHVSLPAAAIDLDRFRKHLNGIIGPTCTIRHIEFAPPGFHARYSAVERRYRYQITVEFSPLRRTTHWFVKGDLDLTLMERAMAACLGEHDFGMFCAPRRDLKHTRCTVSYFSGTTDGAELFLRIAADRFLHNMVRRLAGEMVAVGRGRRTFEEFRARLDRPGPGEAGLTAPPHALFLEEVRYPDQPAGNGRT
jgi:tRNA pseudouridine38-40 synthase